MYFDICAVRALPAGSFSYSRMPCFAPGGDGVREKLDHSLERKQAWPSKSRRLEWRRMLSTLSASCPNYLGNDIDKARDSSIIQVSWLTRTLISKMGRADEVGAS